jgi:predicted regulator of Ras-like GTPase activity (Roadblock/LC7/MglB family)
MDMNKDLTYRDLQDKLIDLNNKGHFLITVLTDQSGLPLASSAGNDESEMQAAVVAQVKRISNQVKNQLGMAETDEISLNDINGRRLVCRAFFADNTEFMLAVLIANRDTPYRRLTTQAIQSIKSCFVFESVD